MSICNSTCICIDERSRYDGDMYFKIVEYNHVYVKVESLKTHIIRRIEKNDFYLTYIKNVEVIEINDTYDFNGIGENGMSLYDDPYTLYSWTGSGNVAGFNINALSISSFGGSESLYNVPYISGESNRALGSYFSSATGKFYIINSKFIVPEGMSSVKFTIKTYNAWSRFPGSTPRWGGMLFYIDGDNSDRAQCTVDNLNDTEGLKWFTYLTSPSTCDVEKSYSVIPGEHTLSIYLGQTSSIKPVPPAWSNDLGYRNINFAIDSIKLEFS